MIQLLGIVILSNPFLSPIPTVPRTIAQGQPAGTIQRFDVVVYGGTAGGVVAAIQCARMGKTVAILEPSEHLGGLTSGGLGATDIGNKGAIGGMAREFYRRVAMHYKKPDSWKFQSPESYQSRRQSSQDAEMWTFEPHVAEDIFRAMIQEARVPVFFKERLDLTHGVRKEGSRIVSIRMESGRTLSAQVFIDASYEGDLMAKAGVSYTVGRESNQTHGESLNGVQTKNAKHHQFTKPVDPYVKVGDPSSGLLPGIDPHGPGEEGGGDHRVQAYNFRICATDVPQNRLPWPKPADYDPLQFELLLRNFEAGDLRIPWNPIMMPNRKTDSNNNFAVSTDFIGHNYAYPDGDYRTRERIIAAHRTYTEGLLWTLANHPRVPAKIREHFQQWGLAKDEFADSGHWPHQLYVREARRLVSAYVMTQHNCQGRATVEDSVGLAAYTMDSHNCQRYVKDGRVWNEGDVQVGGFSPYAISFQSVVPRESECSNLLVPVCLSASHIAYGSIRMEPVFMVLGQSTATAACLAIEHQVPVQRVNYSKLRERLLADHQVLAWTGPTVQGGLDIKSLPGVVVDNENAEVVGDWSSSTSIGGFVGAAYLHDGNLGKGDKLMRYRFKADAGGRYEIRISYTPHANRASNVPVTITTDTGDRVVHVDQRKSPAGTGDSKSFHTIGTVRIESGRSCVVTVLNRDTDGFVVSDAVQFLRVAD